MVMVCIMRLRVRNAYKVLFENLKGRDVSVDGMIILNGWAISVSVVCDYRLKDKGSIPGRGKGFFLYPLCSEHL
jgi:hypothetical protein